MYIFLIDFQSHFIFNFFFCFSLHIYSTFYFFPFKQTIAPSPSFEKKNTTLKGRNENVCGWTVGIELPNARVEMLNIEI